MSRIGKLPVLIPKGVSVKIDGSRVSVKGPVGELSWSLPERIGITHEEAKGQLQVTPLVAGGLETKDRQVRMYFGLARALVENMVKGVSQGFEKKLDIVGVGYNAKREGNKLILNVGYCHPVDFDVPAGLTVEVPQPTRIGIKGADKQLVGQFAANVRRARPPEPYKGKGVRYVDEVVKIKAGKAFGAAE